MPSQGVLPGHGMMPGPRPGIGATHSGMGPGASFLGMPMGAHQYGVHGGRGGFREVWTEGLGA